MMIVNDEKNQKICSFYVSDYHLEMMLVPYINKKIENNENVTIETEKDLKETMQTLLSRVNIKEENKQKILNLGWEQNQNNNIMSDTNTIIIGSKKYIEDINNKILNSNVNNVNVVDCYDFEEVKSEIDNIVDDHNGSLNTLGFKEFKN